jgi:hypothetical protein
MTDTEARHVNAAIKAVVIKFQRSPNIFLTEEDLRNHLCNELLKHFGTEETTQDGDKSISLHCEVRWYGRGTLKIRSDIVLVDVSNLKVLRYTKMPTKGYRFNIPKGIIELKLRRPNGESDSVFKRKIQADINKLKRLKGIFFAARGIDQTKLWLVVLDKKSKLSDPIYAREDGVEVTYQFSNKIGRNRMATICNT